MATAPQSPPAIPASGETEIHNQQQQSFTAEEEEELYAQSVGLEADTLKQQNLSTIEEEEEALEEVDMISSLPVRSPQPVVQVASSQATEPKKNGQPVKGPEVAQEPKNKNDHPAEENRDAGAEAEENDPHDPLMDFDWNDFEGRYRQALTEANENEQALRDDFEGLVQYFGVWATAASQYDNERSSKRIKTRALYVQHAEQSLEQKKAHYTQVVEAFRNALALLGAT